MVGKEEMLVQKMIRKLYLISLLVGVLAAQAQAGVDTTTVDLIRKDGYPVQYFDLITKDGYILQIYRIPRGKDDWLDFRKRPVVFLQHGLQSSPNAFLGINREVSLAYNLADRGFDVWLGCTRGVDNSRRHILLDPDSELTKRKFWDFSYEDIALIDLPRMIDFALAHTKQEKLHYIGHSQGGTVFLALNSRMPEYNKKFISAHLMAGVGYQNHFSNGLLKLTSANVDPIHTITNLIGFVEILGPSEDKKALAELEQKAAQEEDSKFLFDLIDKIRRAMDEIYRIMAGLGGAAVKQYAHYGQNIRDKKFQSWNYGFLGNLVKYGRINPPQFDIKKINVEIMMHYTVGDVLLHENDVLAMAKDIPNCKVRKVAKDNFSHTDFVMSKDAKELVYDYIIDDLVYKQK